MERNSYQIKPPVLVLGNHSCFADAVLMACAFSFPIYIVGASATLQTRLGRLVAKLFGLIPIDKASGDMGAIRRILREIKAGHSVGLYPEGNCTVDGSMLPIEESIGKLAKQVKVPIVLMRTTGGYLSRPKWARTKRKKRVRARVVEVLTPEECKALSVEALSERIVAGISCDAYEVQEKTQIDYGGKNRADGICRVVSICPACGREVRFVEKGNTFACPKCNHVCGLDEYGYLRGGEHQTLSAWCAWEKEHYEQEAEKDRVLGIRGSLFEIEKQKMAVNKGELLVGAGEVGIGARNWLYRDIRGVVLHDINHLLITAKDGCYRFVPDDENANILPILNVLLWRLNRERKEKR